MKKFYVILIMLLLQSPIWAEWAPIPLKDAVKSSDLIVIGTLTDVKEFTKKETHYGSGTITIEKLLYGKLPDNDNIITLIWDNPTGLACPRVEHKYKEKKKGIWLLTIGKNSKVRADHPMRFLPLDKKDEVKNLLPKTEKTLNPTLKDTDKITKLWGISRVKINDDGSVTLIDAKNGMWFPDKKGGFKPAVRLKKGESCDFIDGDHAFINYKLKKNEHGKITFTVTDKFDARSFGDGIKTSTKTIEIKPY